MFYIPNEDSAEPAKPRPQKNAPDEIYDAAAELLDDGLRPSEVRKELIRAGYDENLARTVVRELTFDKPKAKKRHSRGRRRVDSNPDYDQQRISDELFAIQIEAIRAAGKRNMAIGGVICGAGVLITLFTMMMSQGVGGPAIIAWGAILFGGIQFLRGMGQAAAK